ncbi:MAG TPA: hypothetical protein QKA08_05525 [Candidatus Megaira endosymbiont of Nemacystus decipiens]|nr:hypothetical protein [Candidatus Megaera endosymbiont of Nemacystus decipiens]
MFDNTSFDDWSGVYEDGVIDDNSCDRYHNYCAILSPENMTPDDESQVQDTKDQAFSTKQEENLEPESQVPEKNPEDNTLAPFEESKQSEPSFEPKQETKSISKKSLALLFAAGSAGLAVVTIAAYAIYNAVSGSTKD